MIVGNIIGANPVTPKTYIFQDEDGNEVVGVLVGEEQIFTATTNDIREGKVAGTEGGVVTGEKVIPSYHTYEGRRIIPSGQEVIIPNMDSRIDNYDYTKLQIIVCSMNTNVNDSMSAIKVSIDGQVYDVGTVTAISKVTKDHDAKTIKLGIVNDSGKPWIVRFFTYKEV